MSGAVAENKKVIDIYRSFSYNAFVCIFLAIGQTIAGLISGAESVNAAARLLSLPLIVVGGLGELGYFGGVVTTIVKWSPFGVAQALLQFGVSARSQNDLLGLVLLVAHSPNHWVQQLS